MNRIPDLVIIVDIRREHNAIKECQKLNLPVVSMLDTNCNPELVDLPIPANDDAIRSIKLIIGKLADAIYEGRYGKAVAEGTVDEFLESVETIESAEDQDYEDDDYSDTEDAGGEEE